MPKIGLHAPRVRIKTDASEISSSNASTGKSKFRIAKRSIKIIPQRRFQISTATCSAASAVRIRIMSCARNCAASSSWDKNGMFAAGMLTIPTSISAIGTYANTTMTAAPPFSPPTANTARRRAIPQRGNANNSARRCVFFAALCDVRPKSQEKSTAQCPFFRRNPPSSVCLLYIQSVYLYIRT